jgi:hypothetical protein
MGSRLRMFPNPRAIRAGLETLGKPIQIPNRLFIEGMAVHEAEFSIAPWGAARQGSSAWW